jgi:hypothetical protein
MPDVQNLAGEELDLIRIGIHEDSPIILNARSSGPLIQPGIEWRIISAPGHRRLYEKLLNPARFWRTLGLMKQRKKTTGLIMLLRSFVDAVLSDRDHSGWWCPRLQRSS